MADKDKYADEIMSDDELDNVAGGSLKQTEEILNLFDNYTRKGNNLGVSNILDFTARAGIAPMLNTTREVTLLHPVTRERIECHEQPNFYTKDGRRISHEQAVEHLKNFYGLG